MEQSDSLQVFLRADDICQRDINKMTMDTLAQLDVVFKTFDIHTPTLDDIFYEVTRDE